MAQTDSRPGLRLPWVADRSDADQPVDDATTAPAPDEPPTAEEPVTPDMIEATTPAPARQPTKLMADLSKAMQKAAESARDETVARFITDSKAAVEEIQAASTNEAAALRRRADDDVAAVREWSKAEIARIREETEARIAARKAALDGEVDAHAAVVEARVQRVNSTVESFQSEMDAFFERLLAEQDPTRIATMAETMPEPPDLAGVAASIAEPVFAPFDPLQTRLAEMPVEAVPEDGLTADQAAEAQAAMAARLDFAAAEAEALAFTGDLDDDDGSAASSAPETVEGPTRVAAITTGLANADAGSLSIPSDAKRATTRVVVLGLVSVASIATFKRGLTRAAGVGAVGVASGPDGEFVFTIEHQADLQLGDTITALPGFEARITAESPGTFEVTAHDPDTGD